MKYEIDARGEACPKPVIMTKQKLDSIQNGIVTTIVDNDVARDNVSKLAVSMGYSFIIDTKNDEEYYIHITKVGEGEEAPRLNHIARPKKSDSDDFLIAISSNKMGSGEEELGKILMKSFIYTVKETSPWPKSIVFFNSGVFLTCEGSEVLEDLKEMANKGVEITSCGTCLDYYNIKDKLQVGQIGNMYDIYEKMKNANNTINI